MLYKPDGVELEQWCAVNNDGDRRETAERRDAFCGEIGHVPLQQRPKSSKMRAAIGRFSRFCFFKLQSAAYRPCRPSKQRWAASSRDAQGHSLDNIVQRLPLQDPFARTLRLRPRVIRTPIPTRSFNEVFCS